MGMTAKALAWAVAMACAQAAAAPALVGDAASARILSEFEAMGFGVAARVVDFDRQGSAPPGLLAKLAPGNAAIFAAVAGSGKGAKCLVGMRPSMAPGAPEALLVAAGVANGASAADMWEMALRHELGHCALASVAAGRPGLAQGEGFADAFALAWAAGSGPKGRQLADRFAKARALSGSAGSARDTAPYVARWRAMQGFPRPCVAAWTAAPADARAAAVACLGTR